MHAYISLSFSTFCAQITGRDLFTYNPELAQQDDDEAADSTAYQLRAEEELFAEEAAERGMSVVCFVVGVIVV